MGNRIKKTNTRVDSETVERLSKYKDIPLETEKLQTDFSSKIELLNQRGEYINEKLPEIQGSRQEVNFEIYKDLLGRKIQKNATLSEREKKIVELITSNPQKYKNQEKEIENTEICPYCFRKIDEALRREILSYISSSLADDDFQAHMRELEYEYSKIEALKISIDLSIYRVLGDETCESLNLSVDKFNTSVEALLEYIKQKKESVYNPILISSSNNAWNDFTKCKNDLNSEASQFNERVKVFNEEIDKLENFIDDVLCLNDKRGWLAIKNDFENLEKLKISNSLQEKRLERHRQALPFFDRKINNLEAQLRGYTIAKDTINKYLAYVFCDKTRLSLVEKGQFYGIYSRGKEIVSPAQLSQGERNVLALSFFFTQINENLTKDAEFTKDLFIVVDDPISSVDNLNKVGVYSFLRLIFSEITKKSNSQILIFSHSLNAIYNLHRVLENLDKNFIIKELASKRIINFPFKKKNEYSVNLMEVYKFAKKTNSSSDCSPGTIGNTMRKVIEAYSTFNYKLPIENFTQDQLIIKKLPEKFKSYFSNKMFRLVLHTLSHTEETSRTDLNFFERISEQEQRNTARELLVFLYLLDSPHILKHLGESEANVLDEWKTQIQSAD